MSWKSIYIKEIQLQEWEYFVEYKYVIDEGITVFFNNNLSGSIPPKIGNLKKLEFIFLHDNMLDEKIPKEVLNLKSIKYSNFENRNSVN